LNQRTYASEGGNSIPGLTVDVPQVSEIFQINRPAFDQKEVWLDGRRLFVVAVPRASDRPANATPIIQPESSRVRIIEDRLNRIVEQGVAADDLNVFFELDRSSNQPILYARYSVDGQEQTDELLTITSLDARLNNAAPQVLAEHLAQDIEAALIAAYDERQPDYINQQTAIAAGIGLGIVLLSLALRYLQIRLAKKQHLLGTQAKAQDHSVSTALQEPDGRVTTALLQRQVKTQERRRLNEIERRLLQLSQIAVWTTGIFAIFGLFPMTRWVRPIMLAIFQLPLKLLAIVIATYLLIRLSEVLIDRLFLLIQDSASLAPETSQRIALRFSTFARVTKNIVSVLLVGVGIIIALASISVRVGPLLAGAGIIGLAISFASQSLIKDMINGFLILLEDHYGVGDVIVVGDVAGLVENMNLRITQLRNEEGRLITIPNSAIVIVQNLSKEWSRVDLSINVAYQADINQALEVIDKVAQDMSKDSQWRHLILESPQLLGVDSLDHTGAMVRLWIKTQPLKQWEVAREYRRRLKLAFDEVGIDIGVPQQTLWVNNPHELMDDLPHSGPHHPMGHGHLHRPS
jgi:moderate conductance mechanosensitive channel